MGVIGLIILILAVFSGFQVLLSLRKNRHLGLLIPGLNILIATIFGMMGTDYFIAYFSFITLLLPTIWWLGIYKICSDRVKKKADNELKKSIVKDL